MVGIAQDSIENNTPQVRQGKIKSYIPVELDVVEMLHKLEWQYKRKYNKRLTHTELIRRLAEKCGESVIENE